jgi:hypothetical protein
VSSYFVALFAEFYQNLGNILRPQSWGHGLIDGGTEMVIDFAGHALYSTATMQYGAAV